MNRDLAADIFQERALRGGDFELAGSDHATGVGFRVTVRHGSIDLAAFSSIDEETLRQSIEGNLPLSIGATLYRVERSFGPAFFRSLREHARVDATSMTVQSHRQILCIIGGEVGPLLATVSTCVPSTVEWDPQTLVEGSREWGRKVGHAAKDLAGLREAAFDIEHLKILERSGEAEAFEAVRKEVVWPAPTVEDLRARSVPAVVTFGVASCWRMIRQRPARNPAARLTFVRDLPLFRAALEGCRTLDEFASAVASHLDNWPDPADIVGTRLPRFAQRMRRLRRFPGSDKVIRQLLAIEAAAPQEQWDLVVRTLSGKPTKRNTAATPLPTRPELLLDQIVRSGVDLPSPPPAEQIPAEFGITGLELGNYVSRRDGERLANHLAAALADLRALLGDWIVGLFRRGNLSVALGARGKGKGCAHYEPSLRVINLTKSHGDGSLAHECAHFLDHMIAANATGESRYLSARVSKLDQTSHPLATAMRHVMRAVSVSSCSETVLGEVKPKRWYREPWLKKNGFDPKAPPQQVFDRIADRVPKQFRCGRDPRSNAVDLVNSIAKFTESAVNIVISYEGKSEFAKHAKTLGVYWHRPEELFARAFESFVEDEAMRCGWSTPFLVSGTRSDYSKCRGLPYPTGTERDNICTAIGELVRVCASQ